MDIYNTKKTTAAYSKIIVMALIDNLLQLVVPHDCVLCSEEGSLLCAWCKPGACLPVPEICYRCHELSSESIVCNNCRSKTPLRYVKVHTNYDGAALKLIQLLKFDRAQAAAGVIAELMQESIPFIDKSILVTHIPAATSRVRLRGFDQSKLIAKAIARNGNRSHLTLLARLGQSRQVGSTRQQRLTQLTGAFRPVNQYIINNADILLVDDVLTTGATLEEAARTLKRAGARRVGAIVFAHKR